MRDQTDNTKSEVGVSKKPVQTQRIMGKSEQGLKGRLIYRGQELPAEKQKQNNCLHYPEMQVEQQHKSEQGLRRCPA